MNFSTFFIEQWIFNAHIIERGEKCEHRFMATIIQSTKIVTNRFSILSASFAPFKMPNGDVRDFTNFELGFCYMYLIVFKV